jgi:hypothetical protein
MEQVYELVRDRPGITIPQIAALMAIEPNYLYRVVPKLITDELIRREGLGYYPNASKPPTAPERRPRRKPPDGQ